MIRDTSLLAFRQIEPTLQKREQDVIRFLCRHASRDYTRRELAKESGIDLSSVCGRCNRLIALGVLVEGPTRKCRYGKSGHPVRLAPVQQSLDLAA